MNSQDMSEQDAWLQSLQKPEAPDLSFAFKLPMRPYGGADLKRGGHARSYSAPVVRDFAEVDAPAHGWRSDAEIEDEGSYRSSFSLQRRPSLMSQTYSKFKKSFSSYSVASSEASYSTPATTAHSRSSSASKPYELERTPSKGYRENLLQEAIACYLFTLPPNVAPVPEETDDLTSVALDREDKTLPALPTSRPPSPFWSAKPLPEIEADMPKQKSRRASLMRFGQNKRQTRDLADQLARADSFDQRIRQPVIRKSLSQPLFSDSLSIGGRTEATDEDPFR